ncbi:MAG: hypothetical protein ACKPJJ_03785, partial [Planctomycetaceae bacterium]
SDAGNARRIGTLKIRNAVHVTLRDVTAQTLQQTNGRGTTTFNGIVNTTSATGVDVTTTNIVVNNLITTIVDGSVPNSAPGIVNLQATASAASATTGSITMLDPGRIVASNDVTLQGNRSIAPSITVYEASYTGTNLTPQQRDFITTTTAGADVTIQSSMLFSSPGESADNDFIINTKAANGNITLQAAIDGDWNNFVLKSGSGTITTTSTAPMTQVASLVLQDNTAAATGSIAFSGNLLVDWIDTYPQNYSVSFLGTITEIGIRPYYKYGNAEHSVFYNTAGVRFGDDATDTTLIRERLTVATATTTVTGVLRTHQRILIGNVNVVNTASIVTVGGGTVWINGSISGSNAEMRFGEGNEGTLSYNVTGNVTLGTLTTFA